MLGGRCILGIFSQVVLGDLHLEGPAAGRVSSLLGEARWLSLIPEEASADAKSLTVMTPEGETTAWTGVVAVDGRAEVANC